MRTILTRWIGLFNTQTVKIGMGALITKLIAFSIEIFVFMYLIKRYTPLKKISKIGFLNLLLISIYIILNIYYFCNKLGYLPNISYHNDLIILLVILYRLLYLNIAIDYTFKKDEKTIRYFNQNDKRWRNIPYGISTIGKTGCGLGVLAMIHSITETDKNITPEEVGKWVNENHPQTGGTNIDTMVKYLNFYNIKNNYLPRGANLSSELKSNNVICVWWRNYPSYLAKFKLLSNIFGSGHYVLLHEIHGDKAYIADPENFAETIKPIRLTKLMRKINNHPKGVTHPYISVCI